MTPDQTTPRFKSEALDIGDSTKATHELKYWARVKDKERVLHNSWYEYFFTLHFGLQRDYYADKRVLDIGCGPRGSLEWADMTALRVGLDPLADSYRSLGADRQKMTYASAPAEAIPYPANYFHVVSSFNSLDHVDDVDAVLREIVRVVCPGGLFLLLTDVNHPPTICEPRSFSWDLVNQIKAMFLLIDERHFEKTAAGMYQSLTAGIAYDHTNSAARYGILSAKFRKPPAQAKGGSYSRFSG